MSFTAIVILLLSLGIIIGGVLVLKRSAKSFHLSERQLNDIKKRNQRLDDIESKE